MLKPTCIFRFIIGISIFFYVGIAFAKKPLLIVTDPWPPYTLIENNEIKGTDVEITIAVFKKMGIDVDIEMLPWKRCLSMVKHKKADAILDASITDERKKFLHFPNTPVSEGVTVFFIKNNRNISFTGLEDLNRFKAGAMLGYRYCDDIDKSLFTINAQRVSSLEQNFQKLLTDRIDFLIEVDAVGFYQAKSMGVSDQITIIPDAHYCHGGNYLAFSKKPGYGQMALQFGEVLKRFKTTSQYKEILVKYGRKDY